MLKIETMVSVLPMPMQLSTMEKTTTSQTALMGVLVRGLTLEKNLARESAGSQEDGWMSRAYSENGKALSRANAKAMRVSANIAEQPVKNCTRMTKNHMAVPPLCPAAFKKI